MYPLTFNPFVGTNNDDVERKPVYVFWGEAIFQQLCRLKVYLLLCNELVVLPHFMDEMKMVNIRLVLLVPVSTRVDRYSCKNEN